MCTRSLEVKFPVGISLDIYKINMCIIYVYILFKEKVKVKMSVAQSCLTLCDPMDCGHQAPLSLGRILEWVAIPFSNSY